MDPNLEQQFASLLRRAGLEVLPNEIEQLNARVASACWEAFQKWLAERSPEAAEIAQRLRG